MKKSTRNILWVLGISTGVLGIMAFSKRKQILSFVLNQQQESHISALHPKAQKVFRNFFYLVKQQTGYNVYVTRSYSTFAEQARLRAKYEQEQADLKAGKLKPEQVTLKAVARPGWGLHNYGFAVDINLFKGDWNQPVELVKLKSSRNTWQKTGVPGIAKKIGLKWGEIYNDDFVHFEIPMDRNKLLAQAHKQFGTNPENIKGNEVKLT